MAFKYGKQRARIPAKDALHFRDYLDLGAVLPKIPDTFGHYPLVSDWGMLGNGPDPTEPDFPGAGDCAFAGAAHMVKLWNAIAGRTVEFTTDTVLADYAAVTGYDRAQTQPDGSNPTDQGTAIPDLMTYWRSTGIADAHGTRHTIALDLALTPGNVDELIAAMYLFGAAAIGFEVPDYWQDEFTAGQPWDVHTNPTIEGGHFVFGAGRANGMTKVGTWGGLVDLTDDAYKAFNDETFLVLSTEMLTNGVSPEGFNLEQLQADAQAVRGAA